MHNAECQMQNAKCYMLNAKCTDPIGVEIHGRKLATATPCADTQVGAVGWHFHVNFVVELCWGPCHVYVSAKCKTMNESLSK